MAWGFIQIAESVTGGETHSFDTKFMLMLRNPQDMSDPLGPVWMAELGRDVTALGSTGVLTFLVLATSGYLWLRGKRRSTAFLLFSVLTGIILSTLLKSGFDRPRPDLLLHDNYVYTASFPSGQSLMSAIVYLTIAVMLARTASRWNARQRQSGRAPEADSRSASGRRQLCRR